MGFSDARLARLAGHQRGRGRRAAAGAGRASGVQADRHLRRGVRGAHALSLQLLRDRAGRRHRRGMRGGAERAAQGDHPGRRTEPDRPGHRVRLLLRARRVRARRGGHRDHHGQLQSRDGLDRLRHLRPAVFRAAHRRRRARDRARRGEPRRAVRGDRAARRADPAQARPAARRCGRADPRHLAGRDRSGRGPRALSGAAAPARPAPAGERHLPRPGRGAAAGGADRLSRW